MPFLLKNGPNSSKVEKGHNSTFKCEITLQRWHGATGVSVFVLRCLPPLMNDSRQELCIAGIEKLTHIAKGTPLESPKMVLKRRGRAYGHQTAGRGRYRRTVPYKKRR